MANLFCIRVIKALKFATVLSLVTFAIPAITLPTVAGTEYKAIAYIPFIKDGQRMTIANAANGVYTSFNETHLAYYGMVVSTEASDIYGWGEELEARQLTCDVSCNNQFTSAANIQGANNAMANLLATRPSFTGSVSFVFANVWAFGCDYGNGQTESVSQWNFDVGCVNAQCSTTQGGGNSHHQWKSTYGREIGGFNC